MRPEDLTQEKRAAMFAEYGVADRLQRARDSRSKPLVETEGLDAKHESDGGEANRPENPAYFWLGIQAEGRE